MRVTRFAPSTTGNAHLGTLVSAIFTYLHAKSLGGKFVVRLEDLDPERCRSEYADSMIEILKNFGLDWDRFDIQSKNLQQYQTHLHALAEAGLIYRCNCSRSRLRQLGLRAPDGSFIYDNHCRENTWRPGQDYSAHSLRLKLPAEKISFVDLRFGTQSYHVQTDFGDPVVVRKDDAFSYHFSSVLDDQQAQVTDVVRGSDLLFSSPVQIAIRKVLSIPVPRFLHHPLLMEKRDQKLAKLHGSLPVVKLLEHFSPEEIIGHIAHWFRLAPNPSPRSLASLVDGFEWNLVPAQDLIVEFSDSRLSVQEIQE